MNFRTGALVAVMLVLPATLQAQSATAEQPTEQQTEQATSLREKLMPSSTSLLAITPSATEKTDEAAPILPPVAARSAGLPLMIAGGALFVAGLIAGDDAGTVLVIAGAGIGAYGLYLYFQ